MTHDGPANDFHIEWITRGVGGCWRFPFFFFLHGGMVQSELGSERTMAGAGHISAVYEGVLGFWVSADPDGLGSPPACPNACAY